MSQINPIIPIDLSSGLLPSQNITNTNSVKPEEYNPNLIMSQLANKFAGSSTAVTPIFSPTKGTERYPLYNPYIDNEEAYAQNQGFFSKWGAGLAKFGINTATTFAEQLLSIPRLASGDSFAKNTIDPLEEALDGYRENAANLFPNYTTHWEQDHPFLSAIPFSGGASNFWADKFLSNLGFTVGTLAGVAVQDLAVAAATEGIGELPLISNQVGKAALYINKLLSSEGKATFTAKNLIESVGAKTAAENFLNLSAAAQTAKLTNAARYGLNLFTASDTEARIEARDGYRQLKKELTDDYISTHGVPPSGKEMSDIEDKAKAAMNTRYALNMAVLLPSNLLQWNTFMRPFTAIKNSLVRGGEEAALKASTKAGEIGIINEAGEVGIKEATKSGNLWNKVVKPALGNMFAEGVYEEGGQYAIENAVKDYYKNYYDPKNKADFDNVMKSAIYGLGEQFGSTAGLENMFIGALTGALTGPIGSTYEKFRNKRAGLDSKEQADKRVMDMLNNKLVTGFFRDNQNNALRTYGRQEELSKAVENNDVFAYKNIQRDAFFDYVMTHSKADRSDLAIEKLQMVKELPLEEQRKVMGDDDATREDASAYIDSLIEQAKEIQQTVKGIETAVKNPYRYIGQSLKDAEKEKQRQTNNDSYFMFEDYKTALTKFAFDVKNAQRREFEINQQLASINPAISADFLKQLTNRKELIDLAKEYEQQANELQKQVEDKLVRKMDVKKQISTLLNNVEAIRDVVTEPDEELSKSKFVDVFQKIGNYKLGNTTQIPVEKTVDLITLGYDLNKIDQTKRTAKAYYNLMFSPAGLETFAANWDKINNDLNYQPTEKMRPLEGQFEHKGEIYTIGRTYALEENKKPLTVLSEPYNGTVKVRDSKGDISFVPLKELTLRSLVKTEEEIAAEKAEELLKNKELLKQYKNLISRYAIEDEPVEENTNDSLGFSKDISFIASTGTDPFYEKNLENGSYGNFHRRHQTFLFNLAVNSKIAAERDLYKVIPITKKTEESFGLKGIIDDKYPNTIRYVYVKMKSEGGFDFIDQNGDPVTDINLKEIVFTTAQEEDLSVSENGKRVEKFSNNYGWTTEQIDEVKSEWKTIREGILNKTYTPETVENLGYVFDFQISNGIGVVANSSAKNNITDVINTLTEDDLFKPLIHVKTLENPVLENGFEKSIGNGKLYFQHNGLFFFVNNRNFTEKEATNISNAINEITQSILNKQEIDTRLTAYLEGVTRNTKDANGVSIDVDNLQVYVNGKVYNFDEISTKLPEIQATLTTMYHGVKSALLKEFYKKPNTPFLEMEWEKDGFKVKAWDSYQHYLIQKRNGIAPVTTNLIVPQQNEIPVVQKYPIVAALKNLLPVFTGEHVRQKKAKINAANKKESTSELENKKTEKKPSLSLKDFLGSQNNEPIKNVVAEKPSLSFKDFLNKNLLSETKLQDSDNNDDAFRLVETPLNLEGDIQKEREEVMKMLPQVEMIDDLDSLIETTAGGKAWGEAVPHFIYVYEGAPFGVRYHEAFEQVFNYILLPDKQIELFNEFINREGSFVTYKGETKLYKDASFKEAKEQMADEFAEYKSTGEFSYNKSPKSNNWFKRLLSFLRDLMFGKPETLNNVFTKLSQGSYANSSILTPIKSERNFSEVKNIPEILVQHAIVGFTTDMFLNKWKTDADIISELEDNPEESTKSLFDNLYDRMQDWFENGLPEYLVRKIVKQSFPAVSKWYGLSNDGTNYILTYDKKVISTTKSLIAAQQNALNHLGTIQRTKEQDKAYNNYINRQLEESNILVNTQEKWESISNQWDSFMKELTNFLKAFDFAYVVNDEGELELKTEDTIEEEKREAKDSYTSEDKIYINAKNTASKSVKLLFATVAESEFVREQLKDDVGIIVNKYVGNALVRDNNLLFLPSLANYAKLFNYVIKHSSNTTGITDIINNLKTQAEKKSIKLNSNLQVLLGRLSFDGSFKTLSAAKRKTLLQLENVLTKQTPWFLRWFSPSAGIVVEQTTNFSEKVDQLVEEWVASMKNTPFIKDMGKGKIQFVNKKGTNILLDADNFKFLSNIGIPFNKAQFNRLPKVVQNEVNTQIASIKRVVETYTNKPLPAITTEKSIGFGERLSKLAAIYAEYVEGDAAESMHDNLEGKPTSNTILPNYVSYILNDINNFTTYKKFVENNPHFQDIYMGNSYYLNNVFFKDGKRDSSAKIQMAITEGRKSYDSVRQLHKMTLGERLVTMINNNFLGVYSLLVNADGKIEWAVKLPELISANSWFKGNKSAYIYGSPDHKGFVFVDAMFDAFKNEIQLARQFVHTNTERNKIEALNVKDKKFNDRTVGSSLRFFKGILNKDLVELINKNFIDSEKQGNIDELKKEFTSDLMSWVDNRVNNTIDALRSEGMLDGSSDSWSVKGLSTSLYQAMFGKEDTAAGGKKENRVRKLKNQQLYDLLLLREMNYTFNNIEMHKMFFNDPAQYTDAHKRIKSFLSGREYTHSDIKSDLNDVLNIEYNTVGTHRLKTREWGYKQHSHDLNVFTYRDVYTSSEELQLYKDVLGDIGKNYGNNNVADAQSAMLGISYREFLTKAGYRWSKSHDNLHNWLMAWERQTLLSEGKLNEKTYSKDLQKEDQKILKEPIPEKNSKGERLAFPPLKPIISGVRWENGAAVQYLYKTSTTPLYLYFVKNTPLEKVYMSMMKNKQDMFAMESAHKVGIQEDNVIEFYNEKGAVNDLSKVSTVTVNYRFTGIQVETGGLKDKQTQGSQLTKLSLQNLTQLNIAYDYLKENNELPIEQVYENWNKLSESEKLKYKGYALVKEHANLLKELTLTRMQNIFKKLNVKEGEFGYTIEDQSAVVDYVLEELQRRALPKNIASSLKVKNKKLAFPLEASPNFKKIKEVVWSVIEHNLTRPKMSAGGAKILVSALGYDDFKVKEVNGKKVLVSTKYKFYTQKNGKTEACQIALPYLYGQKVIKFLEKQQDKKFTDQKEAMREALNFLKRSKDAKELLKGIGFRIPTQGLNSVDFFEIVEFLPPQMGDIVVFPAEITTKAGSDFDVDKMQMYLKNWYFTNDGEIKTVPFLGYGEKGKNAFKDMLSEMSLKDFFNLEGVKEDANAIDKLDDVGSENEVNKLYLLSLENRYYSLLEEILSLPDNFGRLITPNDAEASKAIANEIYAKREGASKKYAKTEFERMLDSLDMTKTRQSFLTSKFDVGIAAVANTNHVINQISDITSSRRIPLRHNSINGKPSFSFIRTEDNTEYISERISRKIDGTVDAAKDDWLARLLGQPNMLAVALVLDKAGCNEREIAYYLSQPIIQEYMRQQNNEAVFPSLVDNYNKKSKYQIAKRIGTSKNYLELKPDTYFKYWKETPPDYYDLTMLEPTIGKKLSDLTLEEKRIQIMMLKDFFNLQQIAKDNFLTVNGTNWDTASFNTPELVENKLYQNQNALNQNTFNNVHKMLNDTHLGTLKDAIVNTNEALLSLLSLPNQEESKNVLNKISLKLKTQFFKTDDYVKYMQQAYQSLLDFAMQRNSKYEGKPLSEYIQSWFMNKEGNIAQWLEAFKNHPAYATQNHETKIITNEFLDKIQPVINPAEGQMSYITLKDRITDVYTEDRVTAAMRALKNDKSASVTLTINGKEVTKTMYDFYKELIFSQITQFGTQKSKYSFVSLIPEEDIVELSKNAFDDLNADEWFDSDMMYINKWYDSALVPEIPKEGIQAFPKNVVTEKLMKDAGYDSNHEIILVTAFKNSNQPYLKRTEIVRNEDNQIIGKEVKLYKRLDNYDINGFGLVGLYPIGKKDYVVFYEVNKKGNRFLNEFTNKPSSVNNSIQEINSSVLGNIVMQYNNKFEFEPISDLMINDTFDNQEDETNELDLIQNNNFTNQELTPEQGTEGTC